MSLGSETLQFLCSRLGDDLPPLRLALWNDEKIDFSPAPKVTISLRSPRLLRALLRGDFGELANAYISGEIVVDGPIEEVVRAGIALAQRLETLPLARFLTWVRTAIPHLHSRRADASHVRYHYDASNDFYRLWLDKRMIYSCAYFHTGGEDIDLAQEQKLEHICRKLLLKPRERLLDIGCGWGGLLLWAAERHGVTGLGVTLSERQYDYAHKRLADAGVEIRLQDYRDVSDTGFDKIISVGMYEHVGTHNLGSYFQKVTSLLRPGGVFLNQGIVARESPDGAHGPSGGGFIDKYVFPGGALSPLSRIISEAAKAGLEVVDVEDLRPHYARTLQTWSHRLEAHKEEAIEAAGLERYRIWRVYLAGMAEAFDRGWLSVVQMLTYKPAKDGLAVRPWTRDYQYNRESSPISTAGATISSDQ
jgi:cyclopropane-fatty-acyl-phospholipid synthase